MKTARVGVLAALLALGVGAAVSTLLAQDPPPSERGSSLRPMRPRVVYGHGGRLGVRVDDLTTEELKSVSGITSGVLIESVEPLGAAAKAGVQEADIVVEFDGERVRSAVQFSRLVRETPQGHTVKMTIVRGGERQTLDVTPDSTAVSSWDIDEDSIRRDVERGLRGLHFNDRPFVWDWPDPMSPFGARRGRLGVQLETLTPQLAEYFGAKDGGVLVSSVSPGSAAEQAGLKAGDVIVSVNGERVRDVDDLRGELRGSPSEISLGIVRDKQTTTLTGKIER